MSLSKIFKNASNAGDKGFDEAFKVLKGEKKPWDAANDLKKSLKPKGRPSKDSGDLLSMLAKWLSKKK